MMTLESAAPVTKSSDPATRPVHVCYVIDELRRAGTELRLQRLIKSLPRNLVQPHLCVLKGLGEVVDPTWLVDCPILELDLSSFRSRKALSCAYQFREFLRQHEIDLVELYYRDAVLFGAPVARWAGVPRVIRTSFNLGYWLTRTDRMILRFTKPLIHHTITNCEAGRRAAMANYGVNEAQTTVLMNGIELDSFLAISPPAETTPAAPHVGMVANLRSVKGINDFIEAARHVLDRRPEARFSVVGEGELREPLEQLARRLGLSDRFSLLGKTGDIPGYLATLDVAVLSSHSEGMSNSLIEYLAAARPVVATDVGGAREVLGQGEFGRLVPAAAPESLAEAVDSVLSHYGAHVAKAKAGREYVATTFDTTQMTEQFVQFYLAQRT